MTKNTQLSPSTIAGNIIRLSELSLLLYDVENHYQEVILNELSEYVNQFSEYTGVSGLIVKHGHSSHYIALHGNTWPVSRAVTAYP